MSSSIIYTLFISTRQRNLHGRWVRHTIAHALSLCNKNKTTYKLFSTAYATNIGAANTPRLCPASGLSPVMSSRSDVTAPDSLLFTTVSPMASIDSCTFHGIGPGRYPTVGVKASVLSVKHIVL